jgi:outer membrane protein
MLWLHLFSIAFAEPLALSTALDEAVANNLELQQERLELDRSRRQLIAAAGVYDPTLRLSGDLTPAERYPDPVYGDLDVRAAVGWSASVSQLLPLGGVASIVWSESVYRQEGLDDAAYTYASASENISMRVSQPLLRGGGPVAGPAGVRSARLAHRARELVWVGRVESLALSVSSAYWRLVAAREGLSQAESSVQIAAQQLADTREREAEGFAGSGDVLQVERVVGIAGQGLVVAQAELESASQALARLLGRSLRAHLDPTDTPSVSDFDTDVAAALAVARQHNTTWLAAELSRETSREQLRQARNGSLPDLSIYATAGLAASALGPDVDTSVASTARSDVLQGSPAWGFGASLSTQIPARTRLESAARARISDEQAALALAAAELDLELQVEESMRSVIRDSERVRLAALTVSAATQALEADREQYREGRGSSRDVMRSLEELDAARVGELQAEIDLQRALLDLARAKGVLLQALQIDPAGG